MFKYWFSLESHVKFVQICLGVDMKRERPGEVHVIVSMLNS